MVALKWIIVVLSLVEGGWLLFDGTRALVVGDYVTPSSGAHAGQLGPWSKLVSAVGLEPRSTTVKLLHVLLGAAWIVSLVCFAAGIAAGRVMLIVCAVASLWYLPLGTVLSLAVLALLYFSR